MVNSLDEALRTLKNEIRQRRPLGVALTAQPPLVLSEMLERGVLPDLQIQFDEDKIESNQALLDEDLQALSQMDEDLQALSQMGMVRIKLVQRNGTALPSPQLSAWLDERNWEETLFVTAPNASDAGLLATVPFSNGPRRAWLQGISRYQRLPDRTLRFVWLSGDEQQSLGGLSSVPQP